jgi:glycosyltransferase involved in cell wall biosynthesis
MTRALESDGALVKPGAVVEKLAVLCDYPEEGWPSMDLCGEMLLAELELLRAEGITATRLGPPFRRTLTRIPLLGHRLASLNVERLANRYWHYPRFLTRASSTFDIFHIVDHSYAQLVHALPADRTGVYCHDLDAFRCLLDPAEDPRPRWFRAIARRVLTGLQKAALVFHNSLETRREIEQHGLIDPDRLVHAPLGVSPEFTTRDSDRGDLPASVIALDGPPFLLHVGSCIPRKRIDVLLDVFAALRRQCPVLRLVKVGTDWSSDHRLRIDRLGLAQHIVSLRRLDRREIAALYRAAAVVLVPSSAEGFGLPVIEALACGSVVVASDLPVLREVGGDAVVYCPVGEVAAWSETVGRLLTYPGTAPSRAIRLAQASRFTWANHARIIVEAYRRLL